MSNGINRFLGGVVDTFVTAAKKRAVADPAREVRAAPLGAPLSLEEENVVYQTVSEGFGTFEAARRIAEGRGLTFASPSLTEDDISNPRAVAAFEDEQGDSPAFRFLMAVRSVEERIHAEYDAFAPHVQNAFTVTAQGNKVGALQKSVTGVTSYAFIRSRLWAIGVYNTDEIFLQIQGPDKGATLLGHPIQHGAHRLLVEKLGDLTARPATDEIYDRLAPRNMDVVGFQPRRVKNTETLSNHVYGLAIDINATWNPHIINPNTIEIIKRHTDPPVDFGRRFLNPGDSIDEIDKALKRASEQFRAWLAAAMPVKTRLEQNTATAENRSSAAESALWNAKTDDEKKSAQDTLDRARSEQSKAQEQLDGSQDAFEVRELEKEWGWNKLVNWDKAGLFTIPIEFAKQLKAHGFGWGAEWSTHKDVMHFELDPRILNEGPGDFPPPETGEIAT